MLHLAIPYILLGAHTEGDSTLERLASSVRSNMDTSVNPCEDFYQFSCGGWERRHTISPTAISFTRFEELNQQNINSLRSVIESGKDGNVPAVCLAKQFYDACMNTGLLDEMGSQPLLQLVRATGGWNLIGASNSKLRTACHYVRCKITTNQNMQALFVGYSHCTKLENQWPRFH